MEQFENMEEYGQAKQKKAIPLTKARFLILLIICVLVSGGVGFGGVMLAMNRSPAGTSGDLSSGSGNTGFTLQNATGSSMTVQQINEKVKNSVVEIKTESVGVDTWMQQYVTEGAGSGVILKSNGYIVTNNHVIDGASRITVTTTDQKKYRATVVSTDPDTDIAVLKINATGLTPAVLGNSSQLHVGDLAVAIGNPLGELGGTVTAGIISALDRSISIQGKTMSLLQTDTSINPGNSGGGLFNQEGQLVGLVVAKSAGSNIEGLGFAIPVNQVANVAGQLISNGYVKGHVTTGMSFVDMSAQQNANDIFGDITGSSGSGPGSVYVEKVTGSNARQAGFQAGDLVISADGKTIDSITTLSSVITSHKVGDVVKFVIIRNTREKEISLTLAQKTSSQ